MAGTLPIPPIGGIGFQPAPATPFQATLARCSFRGVPFILEENGGEIGRRGAFHEYPRRDVPYAEDLGRRGRRYTFRAYILGDDALFQADVLISALEQPGPGILILPDGTPVMAQADPTRPTRYSMVSDKQRRVTFDLAFVEAGQILFPGNAPDTQANSQTAANNLDTAADGDLQAGASQAGTPAGNNDLSNIKALDPQAGGAVTGSTSAPTTNATAPLTITAPSSFNPPPLVTDKSSRP
jgi:prophage DNA circulation protein